MRTLHLSSESALQTPSTLQDVRAFMEKVSMASDVPLNQRSHDQLLEALVRAAGQKSLLVCPAWKPLLHDSATSYPKLLSDDDSPAAITRSLTWTTRNHPFLDETGSENRPRSVKRFEQTWLKLHPAIQKIVSIFEENGTWYVDINGISISLQMRMPEESEREETLTLPLWPISDRVWLDGQKWWDNETSHIHRLRQLFPMMTRLSNLILVWIWRKRGETMPLPLSQVTPEPLGFEEVVGTEGVLFFFDSTSRTIETEKAMGRRRPTSEEWCHMASSVGWFPNLKDILQIPLDGLFVVKDGKRKFMSAHDLGTWWVYVATADPTNLVLIGKEWGDVSPSGTLNDLGLVYLLHARHNQ